MVIHTKPRQGNHRGSDLDLQPSASKVRSEREGRGDTFPPTHKTKEEHLFFFFSLFQNVYLQIREIGWIKKRTNSLPYSKRVWQKAKQWENFLSFHVHLTRFNEPRHISVNQKGTCHMVLVLVRRVVPHVPHFPSPLKN